MVGYTRFLDWKTQFNKTTLIFINWLTYLMKSQSKFYLVFLGGIG